MSVLIKRTGALQCIDDPLVCMAMSAKMQGKHRRIYPDGPDWKRLSPMLQATVKKAEEDAALKYKCSYKDLLVAIDMPSRGVPIIHIKKRERIEL